jgi:sarcosine dehydrogenase
MRNPSRFLRTPKIDFGFTKTGPGLAETYSMMSLLCCCCRRRWDSLAVCGWLGAPTQGNAGYKATSSLSLEKGYRHWHGDLRPTDNPFMANLGFTCKLKTDTPFLGRSALEARRAQADKGLPERLACFTVDKTVPLHGAEAVYRDGICVGVLREAGFGFSVDASIGYGMVERRDGGAADLSYLREGEYSIETATHGRVPATLHTKALFDPSGDRVKGIY